MTKTNPRNIKLLIVLLFLCSYSFSFGQKTVYKRYESDDLRDIRNVKIHLPKGYNKDSISKFPLTIVLEEEKLFDLYVGYASYFAAQDQAPEQVVVGINIAETLEKDLEYNPDNGELTDDSGRFYTFIRDELIPYVEANYKTSPFISIVGEGAGGNLVLHLSLIHI